MASGVARPTACWRNMRSSMPKRPPNSGARASPNGAWTPSFPGQRPPFPVVHGAHVPAQIVRVARAQKRRLLRQIGLRAGDLDGIGLALLDNWARAQAKVELLDRYFAESGFLDEAGEPRPAGKVYFTALNSARLAAVRLADHLKARRVADPSMVLVLQGTAHPAPGAAAR
jgi:hypothetical protein